MISQQIIDKVCDAASIEEVVGEYVTLKRAGSNFRGLCPFHDDKNPSMSVSPSKGIFKCFSCGKGGNVIQFIMEHEGLSYPLAIKFLADKYSITIEESEINLSELEEEARVKDGILASLEYARNKFVSNLHETESGRLIYKAYLKERGIREESMERFSLGLSGLGSDDFLKQALKDGYSLQQLYDAGLAKKRVEEQGVIEQNLRDVFIERIVFPIRNISGKVLGFGGRIIKKDVKAPKYLNSPETLVYEKRRELYGLYEAKNEIRKQDEANLVEGYLDVISLSQSGIENVVAVSGTAFTEEQARLLKRFCSKVCLLFDGDEAGVNATLKHIRTLLQADFDIKIALFPANEDPDSYMQANGLSGFREFVETGRKNFVEFIIDVNLGSNREDPILIAQSARAVAEHIALIKDPLKRSAFIHQAIKLLDVEEQVLIQEINKLRVKGGSPSSVSGPVPEISTPSFLKEEPRKKENHQEKQLLRTLVLFADKEYDEEKTVAAFIFEDLKTDGFWPESEPYLQIFDQAYEYWKENQGINELFFIRNPLCSRLAADFLANTYQLSDAWEKNYEKFIPTEEKNFKKEVIENLNYLKLHRIELEIENNLNKLKDDLTDEEVMQIQLANQRLQELKRKVTDVIGAVVLK